MKKNNKYYFPRFALSPACPLKDITKLDENTFPAESTQAVLSGVTTQRKR